MPRKHSLQNLPLLVIGQAGVTLARVVCPNARVCVHVLLHSLWKNYPGKSLDFPYDEEWPPALKQHARFRAQNTMEGIGRGSDRMQDRCEWKRSLDHAQ